MTSQLILINAHGVAIASDSAVTVGGGRRTHDTAEKVIPLRAPHRVAVLHSGNVMIHGLPYQLLLNEWISTLGDTLFTTVEEYRTSFLQWLGSSLHWFSPERISDDWVGALSRRFDIIRRNILEEIEGDKTGGTPDEVALRAVRNWSEGLTTFGEFAGVDDEWLAAANELLDEQKTKSMEYWFDDVPRAAEIDAHLHSYSYEFFRRTGPWSSSATLAFVGFGSDEVLPGYSLVDVMGVLNGRVMHSTGRSMVGDSKTTPFWLILPLGQRSAIDLFLKGYDEEMMDAATDAAEEKLRSLRERVEKVVSEDASSTSAFDEMFTSFAADLREAIEHRIYGDSDERYLDPLGWSMAALPTATMATVARSLVELQALRQTTTAEQSTVGGPIDVAVISRSNGFEWVRHKTMN